MPELPPILPETGKFKALYAWLNRLRNVVYSLRPLQSMNVLTEGTNTGVFRQGVPKAKGDAEIPMAEQWDATHSYSAKDLAFAHLNAEFDTGTKAGLYQCVEAISGDAGNSHPSVDTTHWLCICNLHFEKFTIIHGDQRIRIDAGRDTTGGVQDKPGITIYLDKDTDGGTEANSIKLKISDIPAGAGNTEIKLREWDVCVENVLKKVIFLSSDAYDPPT